MSTRDTIKVVAHHAWRTVADIEDPPPTKKEAKALRSTFNDRCGFCGCYVPRNRRERLELADPAGPHAIGNRILTCEACHGSRSAGEGWHALMARRCDGDAAAYATRAARIEAWQHLHPLPPPMVSPEIAAIHVRVEEALLTIAVACRDLRAECHTLRRRGPWGPRSTAAASDPGSNTPQSSDAAIPLPANTNAMRLGLKALARRPRHRTAEDGAEVPSRAGVHEPQAEAAPTDHVESQTAGVEVQAHRTEGT